MNASNRFRVICTYKPSPTAQTHQRQYNADGIVHALSIANREQATATCVFVEITMRVQAWHRIDIKQWGV